MSSTGRTQQLYEAQYYCSAGNSAVQCELCPHCCVIPDQNRGKCRVRENRNGVLYSLNYGQVTARALDPIEKKPLYHYYPGSTVYSLGTYGCNFHCQFCQNWHISQDSPPTEFFSSEESVAEALFYQDTHKCIGVAYTYSEPIVWYEYLLDTSRLAVKAGLKNILVTNGYIQNEPLQKLLPLFDAMNIDLKAFSDTFYQELCGGSLEPVRRTVKTVYDHCHLELTVLLIPGKNDSPDELDRMTDWIASISPEIPVHFSRYFPHYKMHLPATPIDSMERAYRIARKKLTYVYIGNVLGHQAVNTFCPNCGVELVNRKGAVQMVRLSPSNTCSDCGHGINIKNG